MDKHSVILSVLIVCTLPHVIMAECPDTAVIVVASVFGTLAVVLVVLGIIGFLIYKRRSAISRPEKLKTENGGTSSRNGQSGYNNPAFDKDPEMGDTGYPGYVVCKDGTLDKKNADDPDSDSNEVIEVKEQSSLVDKDLAKKTWMSLPSSDLSRSRKSSVGSLDRNNYTGDEGLVEVWLTSQDFIGLGFNIAGSMRDGIFVSQVHNRGPANESGKFKTGDRILSVAISFENMVYEDALTILSYASPYPVKVTLQKEQKIPQNRRLSDVRTNLNHPLYRSQSVDALPGVGKDVSPVFHPQRSASEVRHDKRDSPRAIRVSKGGIESNIVEEISTATSMFENDVFVKSTSPPPVSTVNAVVHRDNSDPHEKLGFEREVSIKTDTDLPTATLDLASTQENTNTQNKVDLGNIESADPFVTPNPNYSHSAFEQLTEQDKIDMIRLTYDDPDAVVDSPFDEVNDQVHDNITPILINGDLKTVPMKPERKKKRSSTNSTPSVSDGELQNSEPSSPKSAPLQSPDEDSENIVPVLLPPTEAPPPVPEESEAEEEIISPAKAEHEQAISIFAKRLNMELAPVTPAIHDTSDISVDGTVVGNDDLFTDMTFSDMDNTLVQSPPQKRPETPEAEVFEEEISSTHLEKGDKIIKYSHISDVNEKKEETRSRKSSSSSSSSSSSEEDKKESEEDKQESENETEEVQEVIKKQIETLPQSVPLSDDDFEKELPKLDMNLNFDSFDNDSVLFKETFPNRNTKETDNGMSYDISVTELNSMEEKALEEEKTKSENQIGKGGIAFEIRDDVVSGTTRTVVANSVHRTASYDLKTSFDKLKDSDISTQRPTSLKDNATRRTEMPMETGKLDWSGQRLVRSGSFTDIPQDDSLKDWTNDQRLSDDDALIEKHIQEDSKSPVLKTLTRATLITSSIQNNNDSSDSDSHCRSISSSSASSGSESPKRMDSYEVTNGEDDGLGTSPETSPVKLTPTLDMKSELITQVAKYGDNDQQAFTVTLNSALDNVGDDEEEC